MMDTANITAIRRAIRALRAAQKALPPTADENYPAACSIVELMLMLPEYADRRNGLPEWALVDGMQEAHAHGLHVWFSGQEIERAGGKP